MPQAVFICTGNICRSPFAERLAAHRAAQNGLTGWTFASAGVGALVGSGMDELMAAELQARGGDPAGFAARQLSRGIVQDADLVLPLEKFHRRIVLEEYPALVRRVHTLGQLTDAAGGLPAEVHGDDYLEAVRANRAPTRSRFDVEDPFRKGPEKAAEIAGVIDAMVTVLIGRLTGVPAARIG